jgi:AcrR family transcriptional regulator
MTDWERARTTNQKVSRESEILAAARKILLEKTYEEITFSDLASHISFSRASIYQYFQSKEEVYLALLALEIEKFGKKAYDKIIPLRSTISPIKSFSIAWANLLGEEKILLQLLSMAGTILEKNCSDDVLLKSKLSMANTMKENLCPILHSFFPSVKETEILKIIQFLIITANGLYPLCGLNNDQKNILLSHGLGEMIHSFENDYRSMIEEYLIGNYSLNSDVGMVLEL